MAKIIVLLAACNLLMAIPSQVRAANNISEVQRQLTLKHDRFIAGKHIDHTEYGKFVAAMASGPAAVTAYLEDLAQQILSETGSAVAKDTVFEILKGNIENTVVGGKPVYVGIATYNHWTHEKYPKINQGSFSWGSIRVSRPNTHQFYVAIGTKPDASQVQSEPTEDARRERIKQEFMFFINDDISPDFLNLYEPHYKQNGLDGLRNAIVSDHGKQTISHLYNEAVGEDVTPSLLDLYQPHLRAHGYGVLEEAIISDHTKKVVENTYRKMMFAEPPPDWLALYQPYVKAHGVQTLQDQILADHTEAAVKATFNFLIGHEPPADFVALYIPFVKVHGLSVLRGAIVNDHGEAAIKDTFMQITGKDISPDWLNAYKPYLVAHGIEVLKTQIMHDYP